MILDIVPGAFGVHLGESHEILRVAYALIHVPRESRESARGICMGGAVSLPFTLFVLPFMLITRMTRNYCPGDEIFLFGFSRVRHFR